MSLASRALGVVETPEEEQASNLELTRVRGVDGVAVRVERLPRGVERLRRPAQVARTKRDFRFGDDAARARDRLSRTEAARRATKERSRAGEIAELRHRDPAKCERRRVIAQRDTLQCAERVAGRERTRRGRD